MNDRDRWNAKYTRGSHTSQTPSPVLLELEPLIPTAGPALDVAGGAGRHALWLAQRGLDVTLADVSDVGLQIAAERARQAGCGLRTLRCDLQQEAFPEGPWELILSVHYLWRPLFASFIDALAPGGTLIVLQPTLKNLQRHEKPPSPFLLDEGELLTLVGALDVLHFSEGWRADGQHAAAIVARRPSSQIHGPPPN